MTHGVHPYPATRPSGVHWLGAFPSHWERRRLKSLLRPIDRRSSTGTETLLSLRRDHGIVVYSEHFSRPAQGATTVGYKIVTKGQLVVNRLQANNGLIFDSSLDGLVSPDYSVFEHRGSDQIAMSYLSLLLRTPAYRDHFRRESTGLGTGSAGFLRLYDDRFLETPVVLPPSREQALVLRFLHHADRRIRRCIRAKQRLITLFEEQKQAILHSAVTRGLDPNVRFKASGMEWLGDVPEHWSLRRFKFLTRIASGQVDPRELEHEDRILIAPNHIKTGTGQLIGLETAAAQGADSGKYEVRRGEIIYSKIRPNLRKAAIAPMDCLCSADMYPIAVRETELRPRYLLLLLLSAPFTKYAVDCSLRVAMPKINREALGECWLWYPSLDEQDEIIAFIERTSGPSDNAIARIEREIALLREYRSRLAADVVTGQLDVGEAAARLPEAGEPDEDDEVDTEADVEESSDEIATVAAEAEA